MQIFMVSAGTDNGATVTRPTLSWPRDVKLVGASSGGEQLGRSDDF